MKLVHSVAAVAPALRFSDTKKYAWRLFAAGIRLKIQREVIGLVTIIAIAIQTAFVSPLDADGWEVQASPQSDRELRPDGVIKGKIILRSGPKPIPKDIRMLVDELEKVRVFTVYVGTPKLEFRRAESQAADGLEEATISEKGEKIYLHKEADATADDIAEARVVKDSNGKPAIEVRFTMAGSTKIAKATTEHMGKRLAIVLNGKVISAPIIQSKISTKALITGKFTKEDADRIVKAIMKPKEDEKKKKGNASKSYESPSNSKVGS